jgi:hypothetical protein
MTIFNMLAEFCCNIVECYHQGFLFLLLGNMTEEKRKWICLQPHMKGRQNPAAAKQNLADQETGISYAAVCH